MLINSRQHFHEAIDLGSTSPAAAITTRSSARQQQQQQRQDYNASAQIPRILHVNYMSGPEQLLKDALKHFRKEWWLSCKAHHPGWTHMFWDEAACEQLLRSSYPWFLDTWQALNSSVVLKSGEKALPSRQPATVHACMPSLLRLPPACSLPLNDVGGSLCCRRHPPVHPAHVRRRVHRP